MLSNDAVIRFGSIVNMYSPGKKLLTILLQSETNISVKKELKT
jgi:hypothetical protein